MKGPHGLASGARRRSLEEDDEHKHFDGAGDPPRPEKPTFPPKPRRYKKGKAKGRGALSSREAADALATRRKK